MGRSGIGDDFRHPDLVLGLVRGVLHQPGGGKARMWLVIPHPSEHLCGVCRGLDPGNVDLREGFHMAQNGIELALEYGNLLIAQRKAGEVGNIADINMRLRHARSIRHPPGISKREFAGAGSGHRGRCQCAAVTAW